tara:strand:+ start:339 stop:674 length:336 start_codon:yes stop_codon:yes gene_type:complete
MERPCYVTYDTAVNDCHKNLIMDTLAFLNLDRLRAFHVKFVSPTTHRGARVRVKDTCNNKAVFLPYNYKTGNILKQAASHLETCGILPHAIMHDSMGGYTIGSKNFSTDLT